MKSSTYRIFVAIGFIIITTLGIGSNRSSHLHQIDQNIYNTKKSLVHNQSEQRKQQSALESLETNSAHVALELHHTNQSIHSKVRVINKLQKKSNQYQQQIISERKTLASNIKTIYMLGKHSNLELLLEQSNPAKIQRTLTYYQYLNKQHSEQISTLDNTLTQAQLTLTQLNTSYQQLKHLKSHETQQLSAMKHLTKKRNNLIHNIKRHIQNESQRLQALLEDKHRLENELRTLSANPLLYLAAGKPFSLLRHHLSWPTKGKLIAKYGTKIDKSQLTWKGVLFKAHLDQPVYAVADGKVIFARWLQGYGLLIIVYHGQGYMTLYGRNHYLYRKTGDIVHAGDQIAAVGDTGGHDTPSLYFAIRHNTLPINPLAWFKRR
jgi:septal ring factor EnvC (AmiA/AmiB activator)